MEQLVNHEVKTTIEQFIRNNFLLGNESKILGDNDSFLEHGIIDSTGILELVAFIEETFHFKVLDEELIPDNLDSLNKLETFVKAKAIQ